MANDARPSRRVKDDENGSSKGNQSSDKSFSPSSSATSDTFALRRSSRETLAKKKLVPTSPTVRKSERLEKRLPTTPRAKGKSEIAEKKLTPSPLRRSDRGKSSLATSSGSKKSDQSSNSSSMKKKKKRNKKKSVKELTLASKRAYMGFFRVGKSKKLKGADHSKKQEREDKFSQGDSNNTSRDEVDGFGECGDRRVEEVVKRTSTSKSSYRLAKEATEDNGGGKVASSTSMRPDCGKEAKEFEAASGVSRIGEFATPMMEKMNAESDIMEVSFSAVEKVNEPELVDSLLNGRTSEHQRGVKSSREIVPSKRKRIILDADSDTLGTNASKKVCTLVADASATRQRLDLDSTRDGPSCNTNLSQELAVTPLTKDRGEQEASATMGKLKESPRDLQSGSEKNTCVACKLGGKLLCCDGRGCRRSYHLSCLDPPIDDVPLGVWYCLMCVRKKLKFGVHAVSEGVESIWDVREVEVLEVDGLLKEREFFVKYKGLAHIHNLWVPESKLLFDAPSIVAKFDKKSQVTKWKQEWTVPHRLLQKRLLMSPRQRDQYLSEDGSVKLDSHYEWLVKWRGLDYEHATWELDNASLFNSPEGQGLIRDYENRHNRVNGAFSSKVEKILESKKCSSVESSQPPGISSGFDGNFPDHISKLHEFWHMGQNAVVIDEHASERIINVISMIQSFQPNASWPVLIISTSAALYLWEDEFSRLAPYVNVVVYKGNKDLRSSIRKLEFYGEGGCILFQVLVTTLDIVMEDLDVFRSIEWELIIIDEFQRTRISSHCAQINLLATKRRLLLVSGQLKESTTEYLNLLSLLEFHGDSHNSGSLLTSSSNNIGELKEKFSRYIVYQYKSCKLDSSRFNEYWVPVKMSNVQLELYCAALISNSALLCSSTKHELHEALHDVLLSCRKCCDHPYLVDENIPSLLTKDLQAVEYLDFGIKASGKLQLLDMMLFEMKKQGLRVLILFQDSGKDALGNILDDFLRQRFKSDSYERIVYGLQSAKKQEFLNKFNDKECGRFVFLLDTRACAPSIKLMSVDTVIIFGSDWNPVNDVRALQKITFDSKSEQIKIFRLYSPHTLEEKLLILAKQDKILESKLKNISWGISHILLMWGACRQFQTLDRFHDEGLTALSVKSLFKDPSVEDVIQDFLQILSSNGKDSESRTSSSILSVQQNGGAYCTKSSLLGELQGEVMEGQPHIFWTKLLEGKHPQWKYISCSSQRNRKKIHYFEDSRKTTETEIDEGLKKRKKVVNSVADPSTLERGSDGKTFSGYKEGAFGTPTDNQPNSSPRPTACVNEATRANYASTSPSLGILEIPQDYNFEYEERRKMRDAQKSLHLSLKPNILQLCKILKLSDLAEDVVEDFLEYVMNNHHVNREPTTILQAFQISLCWTVASLLKQKIDHKESLALARQCLNFNCKKEEADYMYSRLRCLKKLFSYRTGKLTVADSPKVSVLPTSDASKEKQAERAVEVKLAEKDVVKSIKEIQKKFQKQLEKLNQKHQEEKNEILQFYENEKAKVQERQSLERAAIRSCFENNTSVRGDKLKLVDSSFAKEFEELKNQMDMRLKNLEAKQLSEKRRMQEREASWVTDVKSWAYNEVLGKRPLNELVRLECSQTSEQVRVEDNQNLSPVSGNLLKDQNGDKILHSKLVDGVGMSGTSETVANEGVICDHTERPTPWDRAISESEELDTRAPENLSVSVCPEQNRTGSLGDAEAIVSTGATSSKLDGKIMPEAPEIVNPGDVSEKLVSCERSSCGERINDESTLFVPDKEVLLDMPKNVSSTDDQEEMHPLTLPSEKNADDAVISIPAAGEVPLRSSGTDSSNDVVNVNPPSSEDQICNGLNVPENEVQLGVPETIGSSSVENLVFGDGPSSEEEIHVTTRVGVPVSKMQLSVPETVSWTDGEVNAVSMVQLSSEEQIPDRTTLNVPDGEIPFPVLKTSQHVEVDHTREENGEMCTVASNNATGINQQDRVDTAVTHGDPVPPNQVPLDECTLPSISCGMQLAPSGDEQNASEEVEHSAQPVETAQSNQSVHEALVFEPAVQVHLSPSSSSSPSPSNNLADVPLVHEIQHQSTSEACTSIQVSQAPMELVENPQFSNLVSQPVTCPSVYPPIDVHSTLGMNFSDLRTTSTVSEFNNRPAQAIPAVTSWLPPPLHPDPLQKELDRLCKEFEQNCKSHEEMKVHLKSDCDKEIEEVIARIHQKYEIKYQEIEAEFLRKKKEFDEYHHKVLMSKILAEAFRSKCMEFRVSGRSGTQQDVTSTYVQQLLVQQSVQQNSQRPPSVVGTSSTSTSAVNLQTSASELTPQTPIPAPVISRHMTPPPVQTVNSSSALLPGTGTTTRPPQISSLSYSNGNLQGSGQIRSRPPHLRASAIPSHPRAIPPQLASTPAPISNSLPSLPPRLPPPSSSAYQSGPTDRTNLPETARELPAFPNLSALELLRNVDRRSAAVSPPVFLTAIRDLVSNIGQLNASEFGTTGTQVNPVCTGGSTDVVYLSDDD